MALRVWLPLNGSLENKGISDLKVANIQSNVTIDSNGKIGKCYTNSGTTASTITPISISSKAFSMSAWVKLNTRRNNWCRAFGVAGDGTYAGLACEHTDGSKIGFHFYKTFDGTNTSIFDIYPTTQIVGEWVHWTMCYDGIKYYIYKNGILLTSNNTNRSNINFDMNKLYLFGGASGTSSQCSLNDVRIYDHCLSPLEVKEISQGLILHYKLDGFNGGVGENILPNTTAEIRTYEYPSSNFRDQFAVTTVKIPEGEKYTLSFYAKSTVAGDKIRAHFYSPNTTTTCVSNQGITRTASDGNIDFTLSTDWELYWVTYTQTSTTAVKHVILPRMGAVGNTNGVVSGTGTVSIKCVKMEEGESPTAWTPTLSEIGIDTTKIVDSSGYEYNLNIVGNPSTSTDTERYSQSMYVSNGTYFINPVSCKEYMPIDSLTVNIWIKPTTWNNPISCTQGGGWNFESSPIRFPVYVSGVGYKTATSTTTGASLVGDWHMLTGTFDRENVKIYIDGELQATTATGSTNGIRYANNGLVIGGEASSSTTAADSSAYTGNISDVRIYATALSAEDIATLYHTPAQIDNLGGIHGFEFIEKTSNLLNPDLREWSKENNVTCVWNEETKYFDVNTNRDTSNNSRWGIFQNITVKPNTSYLFAVDMMGTGSAMGIAAQDTTTTWPGDKNTAGDAKRYYYILTTTATNTVGRIYLNIKPSINQIAHFKNIYLGEIGEIASIKQNGTFENEDMIEYNENGRITKSGELAGSNFIEK